VDLIQGRVLSEYSWDLRRSAPQELHSSKKQSWCHRCGRLHLRKYRSRKNLCDGCGKVDTSFGTATRLKGKVLVHLEGNDGMTRVKRTPRVV
jgi:ribosomal protein L37AE/L43A